jgi:hypothetical protein
MNFTDAAKAVPAQKNREYSDEFIAAARAVASGKLTVDEADAMLTRTMPDLRKSVRSAMKRQGITAYRLVQMLKGKGEGGKDVPPATVYEFLRGKTTINSEYLGLIFDALKLKVRDD